MMISQLYYWVGFPLTLWLSMSTLFNVILGRLSTFVLLIKPAIMPSNVPIHLRKVRKLQNLALSNCPTLQPNGVAPNPLVLKHQVG